MPYSQDRNSEAAATFWDVCKHVRRFIVGPTLVYDQCRPDMGDARVVKMAKEGSHTWQGKNR
ncbi:hypothetical protein MUTS6_13450 [Escherichia coli]|nr:hypothetical protein MUTS6_13450 [Escherichia coli]GJL04289.1 hypothetical protein TUM17570_32980 [Enterobacter cloacae]